MVKFSMSCLDIQRNRENNFPVPSYSFSLFPIPIFHPKRSRLRRIPPENHGSCFTGASDPSYGSRDIVSFWVDADGDGPSFAGRGGRDCQSRYGRGHHEIQTAGIRWIIRRLELKEVVNFGFFNCRQKVRGKGVFCRFFMV